MTIFIILYISCIIPIINSYIINNPIILLPGLGSSKLIKNNIDIWTPKLNYFLWNYKEWKKSIVINNINGEIIYDKLVKPLQFGDKKALDYHTNIPYIIKKNCYDNIFHEYNNIFPIPYDFRLLHSNDYRINFYQQLEKYIETFSFRNKVRLNL